MVSWGIWEPHCFQWYVCDNGIGCVALALSY